MSTRSRSTAVVLLILAMAAASQGASANAPVQSMPWLHEGVVLTFTWYSAVAAGNSYQEDPNGYWVDRATGRRFSDQRGTSGSGWNQITVTCIDGDKVVLSQRYYSNARALGNNQPVPQQNGLSSGVSPLADPGDYWMDPAKLASLHSAPGQNILVTRGPWKSGDRMVESIRVQIIKEESYSDRVYDARNGLCLHYAGSQREQAPRYVAPGDMGRGNTTFTNGDLIGVRDISVPWANEQMPAWVSGLRTLHYRGPVISRGPLPTLNTVSYADLEIAGIGRGWVKFTSISGIQTQGAPAVPPGKGVIAVGRSQFGGLWAGPEALANLRRGQVLDEDPITRMQTSVTKMDNKSIVISSHNAAAEMESEYDRTTGMLIAFSFVDVLAKQQSILRLQGRQ